MGQYDWIADKKREAMAAKMQSRGMPSYAQRPIRDRYGVSYTGLGPDDSLDRRAPVGMAGNAMIHEGEMRGKLPEGDIILDANTTRMAYPETNQQQAELKMYERSGNLPGYASGGAHIRGVGLSRLPQPGTAIAVDPNKTTSTASDITNNIVTAASFSREPAGRA